MKIGAWSIVGLAALLALWIALAILWPTRAQQLSACLERYELGSPSYFDCEQAAR